MTSCVKCIQFIPNQKAVFIIRMWLLKRDLDICIDEKSYIYTYCGSSSSSVKECISMVCMFLQVQIRGAAFEKNWRRHCVGHVQQVSDWSSICADWRDVQAEMKLHNWRVNALLSLVNASCTVRAFCDSSTVNKNDSKGHFGRVVEPNSCTCN